MSRFDIHTQQSAGSEAAELLDTAEQAYGFIPNLLGVFAESPAVLKGYMTLAQIFDESSFTATERQVIILATSRYNECQYCVAAHSVVAGLQDVPAEVVDAIRSDRPIPDSRLEVLRDFTTAVVEKRGWVSELDIAEFLAAGFRRAQILEVILGVTFKTLSNYSNHIADTPVDDAFASRRWRLSEARQAS